MAIRDIDGAAGRLIVNNTLTSAAFDQIVEAGGKKIDADELGRLAELAAQRGLKMGAADRAHISEVVDTLRFLHSTKTEQNALVRREAGQKRDEMMKRLQPGVQTYSFAGTPINEAVKAVVKKALESGAAAYDVRELDNPGKDDHNEWSSIGVWTPYPQECPAMGSMSFKYTEITPEKIKKDMATEQVYMQINGYKEERIAMPVAGQAPQTVRVPQYKEVRGKGTGNIAAHYDTSAHREIYARGSSGQIWSNNCALLADGSLHGVPAMRRNEHLNLILTNPSLGRGELMLLNFHFGMNAGVVNYIGISGRLENRFRDGDAKFIDPAAVLRAAGFEMSPNLRVVWEGSNQAAKFDANGVSNG